MRQIAATLKLPEEPRLTRLAELFPQYAAALLKARNDLRELAAKIAQRSQGSGRLASAVLGHLNTVVRLLAGAVQRAGLYTRQGIPRVGISPRRHGRRRLMDFAYVSQRSAQHRGIGTDRQSGRPAGHGQ